MHRAVFASKSLNASSTYVLSNFSTYVHCLRQVELFFGPILAWYGAIREKAIPDRIFDAIRGSKSVPPWNSFGSETSDFEALKPRNVQSGCSHSCFCLFPPWLLLYCF